MFCLHLPDLMSSPVDFDALRAKYFPKMRRPLMLGSYQSERLNRCIQVLARAASDVCCISLFHMLSTVFVPDRWQRGVNKALLLQLIAEDIDDKADVFQFICTLRLTIRCGHDIKQLCARVRQTFCKNASDHLRCDL